MTTNKSLLIDKAPPAIDMDFKPIRHNKFYLESVIFLVEDTLFKIPRFPFERSGIFATVFTLPVGETTTVEGFSDEHPFKLEGISKIDFQTFLRVVYPCDVVPGYPPMTAQEWASVLKLSTMWDFHATRKLAIKELSKESTMDPVMKVILGKQYKIAEWLLGGYKALIKRKEAISMVEAEQLGLTTVVRLFHIREETVARHYPRQRARTVTDFWGEQHTKHEDDAGLFDRTDCHCTGEIRREFVEELKEADEVAE